MDMRKPRARRRQALEWVKNLLIVLLVLSALYLAGRSGVTSELSGDASPGWLSALVAFFQDDPNPVQTSGVNRPSMAAQAVRMAVCNGTERFAVQYDTTQVDRLFDDMSGLLGEGLATAQPPAPITEAAWRDALHAPGIYFDFLGSIPLDALYAWLGEGAYNANLTGSARRVLLALDGTGTVCLYYSNGDASLYYACETSVVYPGHLEKALEGYGGNGGLFAFEYGTEHTYARLDPYVLILPTVPSPPVYQVSIPQFSMGSTQLEQLQSALDFRPQSSGAAYTVQGGGLTIRDGHETLTILEDGTVTYHVPTQDASRYPVGGTAQDAADTQIIEAVRRLAAEACSQTSGPRLYLKKLVHDADGVVTLTFGYSLNGAEVRLPGDQPAAEFTVRQGQITDYTIRLRSYEATQTHTLLLGELQAAAAMSALGQTGQELILRYEDNGVTAQACWSAQ